MSSSISSASSETSRLYRLDHFSKTIKRSQGTRLAFNALHKNDQVKILKSLELSSFDWGKIKAKGLNRRVKKILEGIKKELKGRVSPIQSSQAHRAPSHMELTKVTPSKKTTSADKMLKVLSSPLKTENKDTFGDSSFLAKPQATIEISSAPVHFPTTLDIPTSSSAKNNGSLKQTKKASAKALAAILAKQFLAAKQQAEQYTGYKVLLKTKDRKSFQFEILPRGKKDKAIKPPGLSSVIQCKCCTSGFEHTFKNKPHAHCSDLTKKIAKYGMLAVCSPQKILLITPRVTKKSEIDGYRHLFELDKDKLEKVFASALISLKFIKKLYPSYKPHIEWHVGGRQSVALLHTRFHNLPKSFYASSKALA